jgi:hypothetical protein
VAIDDDVKPRPIPTIDAGIPIVDPKTGIPTLEFLQIVQKWRAVNLGGNRIIPCEASGTANAIILTPFDASPLLDGYRVYDRFVAFASLTSDSTVVTATVVPITGSLDALRVYKAAGATAAGAGDVVQNSLYDFIYAAHLNGGAGGFVLK